MLPISITTLYFSRVLQPFEELGKKTREVGEAILQRSFVKKVLGQIKEGGKLYIPHHLENHWVVVCIDRDKKVVSYGEYK